ncbi:MAG TPA: hypothetical protein PLP56_02640 [Candidatus Omnitrophota bacterium]|nr:hypothetical protein [Candidatus Omnitrophota bacterium]HQO37263.1 hypothetical protein [Candidatus Omnitrophota bacterium]HQQ05861.1 hypothetical protein [Candidatus Omnitrophota bacterium]
MQDKIKYIVFGLAAFVILIVMMFLGLKVKSLERERQDLQNQNTDLTQQVSTLNADNAGLKGKIGELTKAIDEGNAQRAHIQQEFDKLVQERDALAQEIGKLKEAQQAPQAEAAPAPAPAPTLSDAYLAGILKQKADLEVQVSMMRDTLKNLKAANDQLTLEKNNLVFEVNNMSRETQDIQHASNYNQKMVDTLTQELAREKTDKLEIAKRLKAVNADNRQLRQQIQSLGERRLSLEKKLSDMQSKNAALESSLASMELYVKQQMFQMDDIRAQMDDARESSKAGTGPQPQADKRIGTSGRKEAIQLPPIVVRPQQQAAGAAADFGKQARIISVDRDNNFVVVNLGQAHELKTGDTLNVYRDGQQVGSVQVIQTRDRIAACDIKDENTPLRVGDLIK